MGKSRWDLEMAALKTERVANFKAKGITNGNGMNEGNDEWEWKIEDDEGTSDDDDEDEDGFEDDIPTTEERKKL